MEQNEQNVVDDSKSTNLVGKQFRFEFWVNFTIQSKRQVRLIRYSKGYFENMDNEQIELVYSQEINKYAIVYTPTLMDAGQKLLFQTV